MRALLTVTVFLCTGSLFAADWDTWVTELTKTSKAARVAAEVAEGIDAKARERDDARERLDKCQRYPDMYDTYSDGCDTLKRRFRDAQQAYNSELTQLSDALAEVQSRWKKANTACAAEKAPAVDPAVICSALQGMKGQYPIADLLDACMLRLPEATCRACLGLR